MKTENSFRIQIFKNLDTTFKINSMKTFHLKLAAFLNLFGALLHTIGGQIELVNPMLESGINIQQKAELTGAWHLVTLLLFFTAFYLLKSAYKKSSKVSKSMLKVLAIFYLFAGIPFLISSFWFQVYALQWILLMPIGLLLFLGMKQSRKTINN